MLRFCQSQQSAYPLYGRSSGHSVFCRAVTWRVASEGRESSKVGIIWTKVAQNGEEINEPRGTRLNVVVAGECTHLIVGQNANSARLLCPAVVPGLRGRWYTSSAWAVHVSSLRWDRVLSGLGRAQAAPSFVFTCIHVQTEKEVDTSTSVVLSYTKHNRLHVCIISHGSGMSECSKVVPHELRVREMTQRTVLHQRQSRNMHHMKRCWRMKWWLG